MTLNRVISVFCFLFLVVFEQEITTDLLKKMERKETADAFRDNEGEVKGSVQYNEGKVKSSVQYKRCSNLLTVVIFTIR